MSPCPPTQPKWPRTWVENLNSWAPLAITQGRTVGGLKKRDPYPRCGPPFMRSNTWAGLRNCLNLRRNFTPWLSPLLELTKARRGLEQLEGQVAFQNPGTGKEKAVLVAPDAPALTSPAIARCFSQPGQVQLLLA